MSPPTVVHRICPLCEATCGLSITVDGGRVVTLRGDPDDPFSRGYLCPKAWGLKGLEEDPDRLRTPLVRRGGDFEPIGWDEALELAVDRLTALRAEHGADAIATYLGNPSAHSLHAMVYGPVLQRALGTRQRYSASSVDQLPKMVSAGLMFGGALTIPVPDVDRTERLLVLGGNPLASNGSLLTAPDMPRRLRELRARGGKLVVIDPRRSETAGVADEHHFIRPGTDALLLLAMVRVLFDEGLVRLGRAAPHVGELGPLRAALAPFSPAAVAPATGISADTIARLAREHAAAGSAACYGRIGTTCQEFGTLASWAVDLLNILTGNLDRAGGAMFTTPAADRGQNRRPTGGVGRGVTLGRWRSRVRGLPESFGELPAVTLPDEILGPGEGRVRALLTLAGNPVLSVPGSARMAEALAALEFMVSVDFYVNETTRHAHLILPPPPPLQRDTYDLALYQLAVRDVARYSPPAVPREGDGPDEWEILLTLAKGLLGQKDLPLELADDFVAAQVAQGEIPEDGGRFPGLTAGEALAALAGRRGPARILDLFLRVGPHGDGFGRIPGGLSLARLLEAPHGLDLGPLQERLPEALSTPDGRIELCPPAIMADLPRLQRALARPPAELTLIGRRHLRSNNSWMHNLPSLVKGKPRCTLLVHPVDALRLGLEEGGPARVRSRSGELTASVTVTDEISPGVVSLPHGFGHDLDGVRLAVARRHAGVNVNLLSDPEFIDVPSGNAALNGVPVTVLRG